MRKVLFVLYSLFPVLVVSCSHLQKIEADEVEYIVFYAMIMNAETPFSIDSFERLTQDQWIQDTTILDRVFINNYISLINNLIPSGKDPRGDFRSASRIVMKNGDEHTLCFGEFFDIVYDGKMMTDDKRVFAFISEQVYDTQPWDYWMPEDIRHLHQITKQLFDSLQLNY